MLKIVGVALILSLWQITDANAEQQMFITHPLTLIKGRKFAVDLAFEPQNEQPTIYNVSLNSGKVLMFDGAFIELDLNGGEVLERAEFMIPSNIAYSSSYSVKVTSSKASISSYISAVRDPSSTLIIQTDRGKYKPGDTVNLRILNVGTNLKPLQNVVQVSIEDPYKNKLWEVESNSEDQQRGIIDSSFTLIDEAPLGEYKITMFVVGEVAKKELYFTVEKYELPKFETQLTLDTERYARTSSLEMVPVKGQVQGYYTNGQFVEGIMRLKINGQEKLVDPEFDGSTAFDLLVEVPQLDTKVILKVLAIVEEKFTGNSANMSASLTVLPRPFAAEPVTPIPYFIKDRVYNFSVKLVRATGEDWSAWEDSGESANILNYKLFYEYQLNGRTATKKMNVTENPVAVNIPQQDGLSLSNGVLKVWFEYQQPSAGEEEEPLMSSKVEVQVREGMSVSGKFIMVELDSSLEKDLACFKINPFEETETAYYQVVGNKGQSALQRYTSAEGECVELTDEHSPKFEVIAYKINVELIQNEEDETEAVKEILVNAAIGNHYPSPVKKVSMSVNPTLVEPGDRVKFTFTSSTTDSTIVGLRGVDKSSQLLAKAYDISQTVVNNVRALDRMFEPVNSGQDSDIVPFISFDYNPTVTPGDILEDAGLQLSRTSKLHFKYHGGLTGMPDFEDGVANRQNQIAESVPDTTATNTEEEQVRKDFRETWLWDLQEMTSGFLEITEDVPDTITSWVIDAFAMNPEDGLSVIPTQEITVIQDLFMSMNLPYSLIRGEKFMLQILVFNYKNMNVTVNMELIESTDFIITDLTKRTATLQIKADSSNVLEVPILCNTIGEIKLEATARDINNRSNSDRVERMLLVEPEGRRIDNSSETRYKLPVPNGIVSYDIKNQVDMESLVEDSLKVYVQVTGDIMGPYMKFSENDILLPTGCGEQTISSMTPGLFIGKYLKGLNKLDIEMRHKVEKVCREGYLRELMYRLRDGSFNAFGEGSGNGSTWLTAYVLKVFSIIGEEEFANVLNPEILHGAFKFIESKKVSPNASQFFVEHGRVIHNEMQGGTINTKKNMYAFSTFIIISLQDYYEYLSFISDNAKKMAVEGLLQESSNWLHQRTINSAEELSSYSRLIIAYALARSGTIMKMDDYLLTSQNLLNDEIEMRSCAEARNPDKSTKTLDVEIHGYELLAYVTLARNDQLQSQSIKDKIDDYCLVDWLVYRRKSNGFFASTQDTSVALQALTEYALVFPEDSNIDFSVRVIPSDETIQVNNENSYLLNQMMVDLTQVGEDLELQMELAGTGTAIISLLPDCLKGTEEPCSVKRALSTFAKSVDLCQPIPHRLTWMRTIYYSSKNVTKSPLIITIDKRITPDNRPYIRCGVSSGDGEDKELSSMVLLKMKLPTCFQAGDVVSASADYGIDRIEFTDNKQTVTVYFMTNSEKTADFKRQVDVDYERICDIDNPKEGVATAFDYYSPENNNQILYNTLTQVANRDPEGPTEGANALTVNFMLLIMTLGLFLYRAFHQVISFEC